MAAIVRIVVILAVFYLVRFALGQQQRAQSKYSDSDSTYSLQEDNISSYEDSNEKVLIRSGVPLRGRTIHQTAWSEEEKVSVSEKDTVQQPGDQDAKEKLYDSWSITNAISYILSFIYDTETDTNANISNNLAENSNENLNMAKKNSGERSAHQSTLRVSDPKENSENIPTCNEDSVSETTPNYPIENLKNEDIKLFRNEISSLSDEYIYPDSDTENSEFSNESSDSGYEEESYENEDYGLLNNDKLYLMPISSSLINDTNGYSMKNNMAKPLTEIRENEPQLVSAANSQESDQESDKNTPKMYQKVPEFSNESPDSEYEEQSYENEDYDLLNNDKLYLMTTSGPIINDTNGYSMKNNMAKPLTEIRENEPQLVSAANSQESDQESDKNTPEKYKKMQEFSNESPDSGYEEESYENEDYDLLNNDKLYLIPTSGLIINETNGYSMKNNMAHPFTEVRENEPQLVSAANNQESDQKSNKNTPKKYQEDDILPVRNTKTDFDQNTIGSDKNVLQTTFRPKQSESETMKATGNVSQRTNSPEDSPLVQDSFTENSMKKDKIQDGKNVDKNESENTHATTERTLNENLVIKVPPTTSYLQNQKHSQNEEPSSNSDFPTQTEKSKIPIDRNKLGEKHDSNNVVDNIENLHGLQLEKVSKSPNSVEKTTVKYADRAQGNSQMKNSPYNDKKDIDNKRASTRQNKSLEPYFKPSRLPRVKQGKDREQKQLKLNQRYLDDIYFDLEPNDDVRSYNYLLDSYEFIRTGNNGNKADKKRDSSIYVVIQDKEHTSGKETFSTLSSPFTPFQDQKEVEVIDKSHESFGTILEYLYKNSNSSFLLSLKEYNSSGI